MVHKSEWLEGPQLRHLSLENAIIVLFSLSFSSEKLGAWDIAKGFGLEWAEGDEWTGECSPCLVFTLTGL
jgi:hypothetical protein